MKFWFWELDFCETFQSKYFGAPPSTDHRVRVLTIENHVVENDSNGPNVSLEGELVMCYFIFNLVVRV